MNARLVTNASLLWRVIVTATLFAVLATLVVLLLDTLESPSPLNLFAVEVAIFASIGIGIYIKFGNLNTEDPPPSMQRMGKQHYFLILLSGFFIAVPLATWLLWQSLYVPSPLYYVALSTASALVAAEIICISDSGKSRVVVILGQMVVIGALVQLSFPMLNPGSVIGDPYFHWLGISSILNTGQIPFTLGYYFYFPSFHVLNSSILEVGGIGFSSYAVVNHTLMILAVPFSYLLAKEIVAPPKALLSTLLLLTSPFYFLTAAFLPVLLGATTMMMAIYVLLRYRKTPKRSWWITFWLLTVFVFFSHPVNALILAGILGVFWLNQRLHNPSPSPSEFSPPTATYSVSYLGYMSLIAVNALTILVQSLIESGPTYYFARTVQATVVPGIFVAQTIIGTLGFAVVLTFAALALLSWLFRGRPNNRFIVGTIFALATVPALVVLLGKGPYGLQAARTLLFLNILVVIPAASGLHYLIHKQPRAAARLATVAAIVFVVAFLSSTSYLTGSGNRFLSDTIPIQTFYGTDSMITVGNFLARIPANAPLTLDPALAVFLAPEGSGVTYPVTPYPIDGGSLVVFSDGFGNASVTLALSDVYLSNSGYEAPDSLSLGGGGTLRIYDNGNVRIYAPKDSGA